MKQARYLNDCKIYLLADTPAYSLFQKTKAQFFEQEFITLVDMGTYPLSSEHISFRHTHKLSESLNQGLWLYAVERFFYLFDFLESENLETIIHLESDSMLYVDFEEYGELFHQKQMHLGAPFQSLRGCIPCFVFIKDKASLKPLIEHMLMEIGSYQGEDAHLRVNDMQLLASFYRKYPEALSPLPTLMPEYALYHPKLTSHYLPDNLTPLSFLSMNIEAFPGCLFDAATLGVYIDGNDRRYFPHNGPGTLHYRALFHPRFFSFFWELDSKNRPVPYLSFKGKSYKIMNLHIHSKRPEAYSSYSSSQCP